MNRVLVTGGTGFIGHSCIAQINTSDWEVHTCARNAFVLEQQQVTHHLVNLHDPKGVEALIQKVLPTHLLHLAWVTEPSEFWNGTSNLHWIAATTNLLESFSRYGGTRAVLIGSCAEYLWSDQPCLESQTPLRPSTLYGVCKNAVRSVSEAFAERAGFECAWARLFNLYGPREHCKRLVAATILSLIEGREILCSEGVQKRDYLHVTDAGSALVRLLESNFTGAVNIASGASVSIRTVVQTICDLYGTNSGPSFGALSRPEGDPDVISADTSLLQDALGWNPSIELPQGLEQTIQWWRDNNKR